MSHPLVDGPCGQCCSRMPKLMSLAEEQPLILLGKEWNLSSFYFTLSFFTDPPALSVWQASPPACSSHSAGTPFFWYLSRTWNNAACSFILEFSLGKSSDFPKPKKTESSELQKVGWTEEVKVYFLYSQIDQQTGSRSAVHVIMGPRQVILLPHLFLAIIQWKWKRKKIECIKKAKKNKTNL